MSENGWNLLEMAKTIGNVWSWLLKAENGMKWLEVASNGQRFCGRCLDYFFLYFINLEIVMTMMIMMIKNQMRWHLDSFDSLLFYPDFF